MRTTLKVIFCLMAARTSLFLVRGKRGRTPSINCNDPPVNQTAYVGGSVTISCKYPKAEENDLKSLYRDNINSSSTELITAHKNDYTKRERFSLRDCQWRGMYNVNITALTEKDAGKYLCVVKKVDDGATACLTKIHLQILRWEDITQANIVATLKKPAYFHCAYPASHKQNDKFLCKGENPLNCKELISTKGGDRHEDRYSIRDNQRQNNLYFNVYIKNLTQADSGTYWCGSGRTMQRDEYTKVQLSVVGRPITTKTSDSPGVQETTDSGENAHEDNIIMLDNNKNEKKDEDKLWMIVGIMVSLSLLAIVVVVPILYRRTRTSTQGDSSAQMENAGQNTEGFNEDHNYEEVHLENQPVSLLPSVYATVNAPSDLLHYATVNFQKNGDTLPVSSVSLSEAQGAALPSIAAEPPIYSTLKKPEEQ